jgi:hypothetical protein
MCQIRSLIFPLIYNLDKFKNLKILNLKIIYKFIIYKLEKLDILPRNFNNLQSQE